MTTALPRPQWEQLDLFIYDEEWRDSTGASGTLSGTRGADIISDKIPVKRGAAGLDLTERAAAGEPDRSCRRHGARREAAPGRAVSLRGPGSDRRAHLTGWGWRRRPHDGAQDGLAGGPAPGYG